MMLFLDTEWADVNASELVSLALVGDQMVFYAERMPLPEKPTDFVRSVVYPLLAGGQWAMSDEVFSRRLRDFIAQLAAKDGRPPTIAYDYWADRSLLRYAHEGFERDAQHVIDADWFDLNELNPWYEIHREQYFSENSFGAERRHNALVDAKAAQAGYRSAIRELARW